MNSSSYLAPPPSRALASERLGSFIVTAILFMCGAALQIWLYQSIRPVLFLVLLASPVGLLLMLRRNGSSDEGAIFLRSFATGAFAAGIAAYYRIALLDYFQLASDASSFFELSSQAGPARSIQDLQTITEGAGAVVLWSWFYDLAALLGFPRLPYVGIGMNILMVSLGAVICLQSAKALYGTDEYRFRRLEMFFTISGILWLFAGIHVRDSAIFLAIVVLAHFWIDYLARLERRKIIPAVLVTVIMMPVLQVLRAEFFYIPLLVATAALLALNFSRGRGDSRFIMMVSIVLGTALLVVALVVFGSQIERMFLQGQETYGSLAADQSRSGSLGTSLIVNQWIPVRVALGIPYLFYFPIPFWDGFSTASAFQLFKSVNAISFYVISSFVFVGLILIKDHRQLRSPAFVFIAATPFALSAMVALTSLESRHLGSFVSFFFLIGLLPDLRVPTEMRMMRLMLTLVLLAVVGVHTAWLVLRYA